MIVQSLLASDSEKLLAYPKTIQIDNNKKSITDRMVVLAREVSQISIFAFPCCMGIVFRFDSHAEWERQKRV